MTKAFLEIKWKTVMKFFQLYRIYFTVLNVIVYKLSPT